MNNTAILLIDCPDRKGIVFFFSIGMNRFPYIGLINLVPVAFFTVCWLARRS
jgi:hypothetical protein